VDVIDHYLHLVALLATVDITTKDALIVMMIAMAVEAVEEIDMNLILAVIIMIAETDMIEVTDMIVTIDMIKEIAMNIEIDTIVTMIEEVVDVILLNQDKEDLLIEEANKKERLQLPFMPEIFLTISLNVM
jgi:hypothetical protein